MNITALSTTQTIRTYLRLDDASTRPIPNHPAGASYLPQVLCLTYVRVDGGEWRIQPSQVFGTYVNDRHGHGSNLFESFGATDVTAPQWVTESVEARHPGATRADER
jgi:hypothetical protein